MRRGLALLGTMAVLLALLWASRHFKFAPVVAGFDANLPRQFAFAGIAIIALAGWTAIVRERREETAVLVLWAFAMGAALILPTVAVLWPRTLADGGSFQDTYYIVVRFGPALLLAGLMLFFAAFYLLFPGLTGWRYNPRLARGQFALTAIGLVLANVPSLWIVIAGFPAQLETGMEPYMVLSGFSKIGASLAAMGSLCFLLEVADAIWHRRRAAAA